MFPKIDSPCPVRWKALPESGRDYCSLCQRQVHNLSAMNAAQRRAFLASCTGPACVAYTLPRPRSTAPLAAGLGLAAALSLAPALASEAPPAMSAVAPQALLPAEPRADCDTDKDAREEYEVIIVGGISDPARSAWIAGQADDAQRAELPLVDAGAFLDAEAEFTAAPDSFSPR